MIELKIRREKLGLPLEDFASLAKISLPTLRRWEDERDVLKPPAYFELVVRYIERHLDELKSDTKKASKIRRAGVRAGADFRERFFDKTTKTDSDCVVWLGGTTVRTDDGSFTTPRKAAWLLKYNEFPAHDVKSKCVTANCVAWQHLFLGRFAESGRHIVAGAVKTAMERDARELNLGAKALSRKYKVGVGTAQKIVEEVRRLNSGATQK